LTSFTNEALDVEILSNTHRFAALAEEWEDLYQNSPVATPFQSWAWLYSWWESYGSSYELRLITMRNSEGLLVGIIPLMVESRWGFGRLLFIGGGLVTPYKDVLLRAGWENRVIEAGIKAIQRMTDWHVADFQDVVDLQEILSISAVWELFRKWNGRRVQVWRNNHLFIDVKSWDDLLMSVSQKQRNNARRTLRKAEAEGLQSKKLMQPTEVEQAAQRLVTLHRELWRGRDIDPDHLTDRFESFIIAAVYRMVTRELGEICEFVRGEEVLVSRFMVWGKEFDGGYIVGASEEARKRYQWSSLTYRSTIDSAYERGSRYLSTMDGDPEYKMRWASNKVPAYRLILGRSLVPWSAYAAYYALGSSLGSKVRQFVKSDNTPQWVKSMISKRYILRRKAQSAYNVFKAINKP
jgi:CelD/BcsL family acetyltransferase involved in cellulose biosynthesis